MRRAAVSIPSNIAEGHLRKTAKDFNNLSSRIEELSKMLSSFYSKIKSKPPTC
ncbi:MAG: four helix bundle protein [Halobacteriota archaeon]